MDHTTKQFLKDLRICHTDFQITQFIVRQNGITDWGCYQQALRELFNRLPVLKQMREQYAHSAGDKLSQHSLKEHEREAKLFFQLAQAYRARLPKDLDEHTVRTLEVEHHLAKLRFLALTELISEKRLSVGTISAIMALPELRRIDFADVLSVDTHALPTMGMWLGKTLAHVFTDDEIAAAKQIDYEPEALLL